MFLWLALRLNECGDQLKYSFLDHVFLYFTGFVYYFSCNYPAKAKPEFSYCLLDTVRMDVVAGF